MNQPVLNLKLHQRSRTYTGGETLSGEFQVERVPLEKLRAIELSVLWLTEGKGDEDLAVHFFQRYDLKSSETPLTGLFTFSTQLPFSPQSYNGSLFRIRWCVRLRAFMTQGKEVSSEVPFQLGHLIPRRNTNGSLPLRPGEKEAGGFQRAEPGHLSPKRKTAPFSRPAGGTTPS